MNKNFLNNFNKNFWGDCGIMGRGDYRTIGLRDRRTWDRMTIR